MGLLTEREWDSWAMRWDTQEKKFYAQIELAGWKHTRCADTAPHAICLAALKAVGYKFEEES